MKIILNENHINLLTEKYGYVSIFQKIINILYIKIVNSVLQSIRNNNIEIDMKNMKRTSSNYYNCKTINKDKPIKDLILDKQDLLNNKINEINKITIKFLISKNFSAKFNYNEINILNDGNVDNITLYVNVLYIISFTKNLREVLQHELTHVYEIINRYKKNGKNKTMNYLDNRYYSIEDDTISNISYYFSQIEINAVISQFYQVLLQNNATYKMCNQLFHNSKCGQFYEEMKKIRETINNNDECIQEIIKFSNNNPSHKHLFPTFKRNNINYVRKRMLQVIDKKMKIFRKKILKLTNSFIMNK